MNNAYQDVQYNDQVYALNHLFCFRNLLKLAQRVIDKNNLDR